MTRTFALASGLCGVMTACGGSAYEITSGLSAGDAGSRERGEQVGGALRGHGPAPEGGSEGTGSGRSTGNRSSSAGGDDGGGGAPACENCDGICILGFCLGGGRFGGQGEAGEQEDSDDQDDPDGQDPDEQGDPDDRSDPGESEEAERVEGNEDGPDGGAGEVDGGMDPSNTETEQGNPDACPNAEGCEPDPCASGECGEPSCGDQTCGDDEDPMSCPADCPDACGDGLVTGAEACDDGNVATERCEHGVDSCEVCDQTCRLVAGATSACGDGTLDASWEACDDGNIELGDGCDDDCQLEPAGVCGDGEVTGGEHCDEGNTVTETCGYGAESCLVCDANCMIVPGEPRFCGDGVVTNDEECDDGNAIEGDGCTDCLFDE